MYLVILVKKLSTIFDRIVDGMAVLAFLVIVFVMFSVSVEVTARYVFNIPVSWVHETTEYSLLFMTMLAATWVLKSERHVKMEVVFNRFRLRTRFMLNTVTSIIMAIVFMVAIWYGTIATVIFFQTDRYTGILVELPLWVIMLVIPICSFFLSIQLMRRAYSNFRSFMESA